jgi:hypothetical protein
MHFRKIAFSAFMLATSLYIFLPTADEILIRPTFGFFLSYAFNLPYVYGVLLSIIIYRVVGVACLVAALLVGGKPTYFLLKEKIAKIKVMKRF